MAGVTHAPSPGPRPPLGVLVLDDGATFRLDTPYVVGREPERDGDVASGRARALRIDDPDGVVSRVHARVELDGWDVVLVDLGSSNGTHVCEQGTEDWIRIPPRTPVPIRPGTRVLFGRRGIRYESHRNQ
jgi:pSer/pThr/pTyr-binding forkhead associated (FHA) protein